MIISVDILRNELYIDIIKYGVKQMANVPSLENNCNSWTIVEKATGEAIFETFTRKIAERINQDKYEVLTTLQWLIRFNQQIKNKKV
jgi:hypothetical protein